MAQVAVYEFKLDDGTVMGCGTRLEFDHWTQEGVFDGYVLGGVIGYEPSAQDDRRAAAWGRVAREDGRRAAAHRVKAAA